MISSFYGEQKDIVTRDKNDGCFYLRFSLVAPQPFVLLASWRPDHIRVFPTGNLLEREVGSIRCSLFVNSHKSSAVQPAETPTL